MSEDLFPIPPLATSPTMDAECEHLRLRIWHAIWAECPPVQLQEADVELAKQMVTIAAEVAFGWLLGLEVSSYNKDIDLIAHSPHVNDVLGALEEEED